MSGYFKWVIIKYKKVVVDVCCGKMFVWLIKNIEVVVCVGGGDLVGNFMFYDVIQKVKKSLVFNENIEWVCKCGVGEEVGGVDWQIIMYEGYVFNGVVVLIECLIDNCNCVVSEVWVVMMCNGGIMVDLGLVFYLFFCKGVVILEKNGLIEDDVLVVVLEVGVEDVNDLGDSFEVIFEFVELVVVCSVL